MLSKGSETGLKDDAEVEAVAIAAFGNPQTACDWLHHENLALGMSPAAYLNQGNDKNEVLRMLHAIAHGGVV